MKRRLALVAGLALGGCASHPAPAPVHLLTVGTTTPPPVIDDAAQKSLADAIASTTTLPAHTAARRASRSATRRPAQSPGGAVASIAVTSTAYCETGLMANGHHTYTGAVAMNGQPIGSRWLVTETGRTYTVADRIGHGSQFDIAMPGDCDAARAYGRRTIHIERTA